MMKHIVDFAHNKGSILVELDDGPDHGDRLSTRTSPVIEKATKSFNEAVAGIGPIAAAILAEVTALAPENVSVEFGIKFSAQAGVIIASSALEGNCKITLGWKRAASGA
jgi:hypothetical protein